MDAGTLGNLVPLFQTALWCVSGGAVLAILRKPASDLFKYFLTAKSLEFGVGKAYIKAQAVEEMKDLVNSVVPNAPIDKSYIDALLEAKLREINGTIQHLATKSDVRTRGSRHSFSCEVNIRRENGEEFRGEGRDVSEGGIGFQCSELLRLGEVVRITTLGHSTVPIQIPEFLRIVQVRSLGKIFRYGGQAWTPAADAGNDRARHEIPFSLKRYTLQRPDPLPSERISSA